MAANQYRIESESPAVGDLMFWSIVGHEGLSRPSAYELTVLSKNPRLDPQQILGVAFDVVIDFEDAEGARHQRHCQGHAVRLLRCGQLGRYSEYRIVLRSWFWLLKKRINSRIHQTKKLLDIMNLTLDDSAITRFKKLDPGGAIGSHKERGYCVQYQESDYSFLSRLLEDEGVYYWFDAHDAPGTLVLAGSAHQKLPAASALHRAPEGASTERFNEIIRWSHSQRLDAGRYAATDTNFKTIRHKLRREVNASEPHELGDLEEFEYTGGFFTDEQSQVKAEIHLDELPSRRDRHWAVTKWPDVAVGRSFSYSGDPTGGADGDYLIAGCSFVATHAGYEGMLLPPRIDAARSFLQDELRDDSINHGTEDLMLRMLAEHPALSTAMPGQSLFLLTVLPAALVYKPPRLAPWVRMPGPQSAIVVGEHGEEKPKDGQDLYVDETGRVKVYFHWNRYEQGAKPHDGQKWSCWLRVSQPWAGKGYGGYFTPRIGQEVIVDFLDGNPDRPMIVGRVYNDDQEIPYASPTQSGFRTRSTPKGGVNNYNEIMFEDQKGAENINIHAERNMSRSVEVDDSTSVGQHQTNTIKQNRTTTITEGNDKLIIAKGNRSTEIQTG
ncbi:MAG: type VI secretion system tip protein VgrG, partial [Comamonadaceae bacterium]